MPASGRTRIFLLFSLFSIGLFSECFASFIEIDKALSDVNQKNRELNATKDEHGFFRFVSSLSGERTLRYHKLNPSTGAVYMSNSSFDYANHNDPWHYSVNQFGDTYRTTALLDFFMAMNPIYAFKEVSYLHFLLNI
ncbi:unnamed protein product [Bursaphelenchus xylophilus]|uniref:(pine wood nematode) hypothetical protein n=1 Tax=Bursaphelenchus xylophilus TaxID=6326 RepID=A0A1I7RMH3_BURXY|nr:unnamed protein product [Bursaphelenchus xylophilus]CAG9118490.1 unnamed protein product [Bursaphelenchus xylophilus]